MNAAGILANFPGIAAARIPQDLCVFFDDFVGLEISETAEESSWLATVVAQAAHGLSSGDGTSESMDEAHGMLVMTTEATAGDGCNLQVNGEAFGIEPGYPLYFETRINFQDISNTKCFIGLSQADTTILAGANDMIGWRLLADVLSAITEESTNEKTTDTGITETDDDWIRLAFLYDGNDTITFYQDTNDDGQFDILVTRKISTTADYVPDDEMLTPSIEATSDATASAEVVWVDYILCVQKRFRE